MAYFALALKFMYLNRNKQAIHLSFIKWNRYLVNKYFNLIQEIIKFSTQIVLIKPIPVTPTLSVHTHFTCFPKQLHKRLPNNFGRPIRQNKVGGEEVAICPKRQTQRVQMTDAHVSKFVFPGNEPSPGGLGSLGQNSGKFWHPFSESFVRAVDYCHFPKQGVIHKPRGLQC